MQERRIDSISGPPDPTRPKNPWPRLGLFFLVVIAGLVLFGYCVASFASPPPRELRVELNAIEPGLPRFIPVTIFGADRSGSTYGAWVTWDGEAAQAFLSRQPESLCHLGWNATYEREDEPVRGAFVDPCSEAIYTFEGEMLNDTAPKDMDVFPTRMEGREIVVDIMRLRLGECRDPGATACSPAGETRELRMPRDRISPDFATDQ